MPHGYVSLDDMKRMLDIGDTTDDARLRSCIEAASEALDTTYNRRFQPYTATRYYTAKATRALKIDDLLSVTALKTLTTNSGGSRVYGDTWDSTDYGLWPYDAPFSREPYTQIEANPGGRFSFPLASRGVEVTGTWGYTLDLVAAGVAAEALGVADTTYDVSSGAAFAPLQTILVDDEQMYITGITNDTLTVERGVNGTVAAEHEDAVALYTYRYPRPVVEACIILAVRLFRRKDAPFGVVGSPEFGLERAVASDPDIRRLMSPFARYTMVTAP